MPSLSSQQRGRDRYYLIGRNVSESPSPSMMNAAFSKLSIEAEYLPLSLDPESFEGRFQELKQQRAIKGMNVTIPFKSRIIPLLDRLDALSKRIRAVNTVKRKEEREGTTTTARLVGYNTDVEGIVRPLRKLHEKDKEDIETAAVIGAGGAARAFFEALRHFHCKRVTILARERMRASQFAKEMESTSSSLEVELLSFSESVPELRSSSFDLLFNASPIGSQGIPLPEPIKAIARRSAVIFDAVYKPVRTELITEGEKSGARVIFGHEMLLYQGAAAFELWTGRQAPFDTMKEKVLDSLEVEAK